MIQELSQIETETIEVGLEHVVDRISKQYETFPVAFQKEAIQNAWDARLDRKKARNWGVVIDLIPNNGKTHVVIEDFGTLGMDSPRWGAFTALWKPKKEHADAGGQGQGKFVLMGASKFHRLIVESKSQAISYKCRFLQNGQKDTQRKEYFIDDFISGVSPLGHQGTKVWAYSARESFLNAINSKDFIQGIASTWWQVLKEPFNAKIFFLGKQVTLPKLPPASTTKETLENKKIGNFGRIKRLVLELYQKDLPSLFTGVAVQRAQMMITRIPFEVYNSEYKNRLSGCITFDEKLEFALNEIEKTDHCGFVWESPWKEVKRLVEKEIEKFKNEVIPKREKSFSISTKLYDEIVTKANQIIMDYLPDVGQTEGTDVPPIKSKLPPPLRIDSLIIDKKQVKYNETIQPRCTIKNKNNVAKKAFLRVDLKYHTGVIISKEEYKFRIKPGGRKALILSEIKLDDSYKKGKYTIRAILRENRHDIHSKATSFYLEAERSPVKKGFIKKINLKLLDDPTIRNTPVKDGNITVNINHPDCRNILDSFKDRKRLRSRQLVFYVIKIVLDEAIRESLKRLKLGQELDLDSHINELMNVRDKMYCEVYA